MTVSGTAKLAMQSANHHLALQNFRSVVSVQMFLETEIVIATTLKLETDVVLSQQSILNR